ncbi:hypothetical protein N7478_007177 [Penicillium angulare]|uniref:uncharacterized protein n=1 Tax=Penicillium angulare TaxID=116970 RepID=UPI00254127AF|nr:uncharacterized protein N7478_007177 [Penicillium angulare]KAJ5281805.1 hypothetical protein N7478_007177 [Penicillium angulare]
METPPPDEKPKIPDELQFGDAVKRLIELDLEITNANGSHNIQLPSPKSSPGGSDKCTETFQTLVDKLQHGLDLQAESVTRAHKQILILKEGLPTRFKECLESATDIENIEHELMQADVMITSVAQAISRVTKTSEDLPRAKEELGYVQNASKEIPEEWKKLMEDFDNLLRTVDTLKNDMAFVMSQLLSGKTDFTDIVEKSSSGDAKDTSSIKEDEQKTLSTPDDKKAPSNNDEKISSSTVSSSTVSSSTVSSSTVASSTDEKKGSTSTPEDSKKPLVANLTKGDKA